MENSVDAEGKSWIIVCKLIVGCDFMAEDTRQQACRCITYRKVECSFRESQEIKLPATGNDRSVTLPTLQHGNGVRNAPTFKNAGILFGCESLRCLIIFLF